MYVTNRRSEISFGIGLGLHILPTMPPTLDPVIFLEFPNSLTLPARKQDVDIGGQVSQSIASVLFCSQLRRMFSQSTAADVFAVSCGGWSSSQLLRTFLQLMAADDMFH